MAASGTAAAAALTTAQQELSVRQAAAKKDPSAANLAAVKALQSRVSTDTATVASRTTTANSTVPPVTSTPSVSVSNPVSPAAANPSGYSGSGTLIGTTTNPDGSTTYTYSDGTMITNGGPPTASPVTSSGTPTTTPTGIPTTTPTSAATSGQYWQGNSSINTGQSVYSIDPATGQTYAAEAASGAAAQTASTTPTTTASKSSTYLKYGLIAVLVGGGSYYLYRQTKGKKALQ